MAFCAQTQCVRAGGEAIGKRPAKRIVDIDGSSLQRRPSEQLGLGFTIGFHPAVVVEMVAREIGEGRDLERHRGDATLLQRVRGHFHRHVGGALFAERSQQPLHADRVRRSALAFADTAMQAGAQGTDGRRAMTKLLQRLGQQLHG